MRVTFTEDELAFRDDVRAFFRDELPEDIVEKQRLGVPLEQGATLAQLQRLQPRRGFYVHLYLAATGRVEAMAQQAQSGLPADPVQQRQVHLVQEVRRRGVRVMRSSTEQHPARSAGQQ